MKTELQVNDGKLTLSISGELSQLSLQKDYWLGLNANEKSKLAEAKQLVVDLSEVERADSAGLAWLLNLKRDLKANTISATITNSPNKLVELAKLSNTDTLLD